MLPTRLPEAVVNKWIQLFTEFKTGDRKMFSGARPKIRTSLPVHPILAALNI
jgi:hypothetical protein